MDGATVTYSNLESSNTAVGLASFTGSGLEVSRVSQGTTVVTFDYAGSNGITGTVSWTVIFL